MKNGLKGALSFTSQITEPSVDKFLPAPALDQFGRSPRTIVIDLEGTLVNCDWTREEGWIVTKRPGTDEFLSRLFQAGFEIVLFSENPEYV
jgi:TFIIF-interacting CTD phosphatase-like protein